MRRKRVGQRQRSLSQDRPLGALPPPKPFEFAEAPHHPRSHASLAWFDSDEPSLRERTEAFLWLLVAIDHGLVDPAID